jgi:hypothetical protein
MKYSKKHRENSSLHVFVVCLLLLTGSWIKVSYCQINHSVTFDQDELKIRTEVAEDKNSYSKIDMPSLRRSYSAGKPDIPFRYINLIIPSDKDVSEIVIEKTESENLSVSNFIYPAQPDVPISLDKKSDFVKPDPAVYEKDANFPSEIVKIVHSGYFDGSNHIVTLAVYPMQYNPQKGSLIFYKSVNFRLNFQSTKTQPLNVRIRKEKNQQIYNTILERLVNNSADIPSYQDKPAINKISVVKSGPLPFYEYVIITSSSLSSAFDDFVSWKIRKGLDIGIVTVEDISSNYTGDFISGINDEAGKLRQYLSDAYQDCTVWALLAGDHSIVPVRYGASEDNCGWYSSSYQRIPADLYFADFNGDWNVDGTDSDGNIRYGEPYDDNPDYNPEIFVGRLPCNSTQDIIFWVEKLLTYEMDPGNGDYSYLANSFFIRGYDIWVSPDSIAPHCPTTFNHTIWQNYSTLTAAEVVTEMSSKYGLLNWNCHGFPAFFLVDNRESGFLQTKDSYPWNEGLSDGLDNMTNDQYYSVVYSICCNIAAFDDFRDSEYRCMAEGFTCFFDNKGGPALIGNTRTGHQIRSPELQMAFYDLLTAGTNDPESGESYLHLGVAQGVSKQGGAGNHHVRYTSNLFGCPETQIWTDAPTEFSAVSISDNGSSITVNTGVIGSNICVSSLNDGADYHLLASDVSSYTFTTTVRPLYITVTRNNYIPYTAVTGGYIPENQQWYGNLDVLGTISTSTHTLTIQPGTTINFKNNSSLNVTDGNLIAIGTAEKRITFDFGSISSSPTNGIKFQDGSEGTLEYCNIKKAYYGIFATYNSDVHEI